MRQVVVGMGESAISTDGATVLVTYALGSCVAIMLHDPIVGVGGMLHFMLPDSVISAERSTARPNMFADTGIPRLLQMVLARGADKRRLSIVAAGGAKVMDGSGVFDIGKRNCLAFRKVLWRHGLVPHAEEIGGTVARTVRMEIGTGRIWLQTAGQDIRELNARGVKVFA